MKQVAPAYYKNFKCIAGKCTHNCCMAGWEIDIDEITANYYKNVTGDFGNKLRKNISYDGDTHFILDQNNCCPFLNKNNLCDIYLNLGPESLCQICQDHPRYYEWFSNVKECGIGLCCEEAARIILSYNQKFSTYETDIPNDPLDNYDEELYQYLIKSRKKIINYLDNDNISLNQKIKNIIWYANILQQNIDNNLLDEEEIIDINIEKNYDIKNILNYFLKLEPNDKNWIFYLEKYINNYDNFSKNNFEKIDKKINIYLKNISIYFIWRYFLKATFDEEILSKIKLMAVSILVIKYLFLCHWNEYGKLELNDCIDIVRRYSEEIEYSEENLIALADASYEENFFSVENLIKQF